MRATGFSTGSLANGDFLHALNILSNTQTTAVELSALRLHELEPLSTAAASLDLNQFSYVSVHAPSRFGRKDESRIVRQLQTFTQRGWPVVVHPDVMSEYDEWSRLESMLLIENMDKRKSFGRTASELSAIFEHLPEAKLCFDIAHARQFDSSMMEAFLILREHASRLRQIHISEVSTNSTHAMISIGAMHDFREVSPLIPADVPVIIEGPVTIETAESEMKRALASLHEDTPEMRPVETAYHPV